MSQERPDWYKRADKGPFAGRPFDGRPRREVETRIAGGNGHHRKRRTYGMAAGFTGAALLALCVVLLLIRLQAIPGGESSGDEAPAISVADGDGGSAGENDHPSGTVRAEGISGDGKLLVVAQGEESRTTLGAPSCLGGETDIQYRGNYNVVYEDGTEQTDIAVLRNLTFIQPDDGIVEMTKLPFPDADVFLLVPAYADCHGLTLYALAVTHDGSGAALLDFRTSDGTTDSTSYYRPGAMPSIKDGLLVLPGSEGPGGETPTGPQDRKFMLDLSAKAFIQVQSDGAETGGKLERSFSFGGRAYRIAYPDKNLEYYTHAAELDNGIVWAPAPAMTGLDPGQELNAHPTAPFTLYLHAAGRDGKSGSAGGPALTELTPDNSLKLLTLPLKDGDNYVFLSGLYGAGDYVVYSTYSRQPGMNQPYREQLWALDSTNPGAAKHIRDYHSSGGFLFSLGIEKEEGDVVTVVGTPDGDGEYKREALVYSLKTGKSFVPDAYREAENGIEYVKDGRNFKAASVY